MHEIVCCIKIKNNNISQHILNIHNTLFRVVDFANGENKKPEFLKVKSLG